jgi:hypothetical protein
VTKQSAFLQNLSKEDTGYWKAWETVKNKSELKKQEYRKEVTCKGVDI